MKKITLETLKKLIKEETQVTGDSGIMLDCDHNVVMKAFGIRRYSGNGYGEDGFFAFSDIGGREEFDRFQEEDAIFTTNDGWRIIDDETGESWTMYDPENEPTDYQEDDEGNEIDEGNDPYVIELNTPDSSSEQEDILDSFADGLSSSDRWEAFEQFKKIRFDLSNWSGWEEYINDNTYDESLKDTIHFIKKLRERWGDDVIPEDYQYWEA